MKCPFCGNLDTKVIDSRLIDNGKSIRRRRECINCRKRFNTFEKVETISFMVVKKDNSRQNYDRAKLLSGIKRACVKRPVAYEKMESMAVSIENDIMKKGINEIKSTVIGDMILEQLKSVDEVAYVRFASVYKRFNDIESFVEELDKLKNEMSK